VTKVRSRVPSLAVVPLPTNSTRSALCLCSCFVLPTNLSSAVSAHSSACSRELPSLPASLRDSSLFFARLAQRKQWCYSSIPPNPHPDRSQPTHTSYYTTTTSTTCAPSGPPSSLSHPSSPPPSLSFRLLYSAQSFCWLLLLSPHKSLPARPLRRPNFSLASLFFRLARRPRVVFLLLCALRVYHNCSAIRRLLQASRLSGSSGVGHCICARRFEVVSTEYISFLCPGQRRIVFFSCIMYGAAVHTRSPPGSETVDAPVLLPNGAASSKHRPGEWFASRASDPSQTSPHRPARASRRPLLPPRKEAEACRIRRRNDHHS
jgi:hypothetical protein